MTVSIEESPYELPISHPILVQSMIDSYQHLGMQAKNASNYLESILCFVMRNRFLSVQQGTMTWEEAERGPFSP